MVVPCDHVYSSGYMAYNFLIGRTRVYEWNKDKNTLILLSIIVTKRWEYMLT